MDRDLRKAVNRHNRQKLPHDRPDISKVDVSALKAALETAIEGEVRFDAQARAIYSTDASNYREVPIGAVLPKSAEDVERAVAICREHGAPILSRGGGTSLAGQCCNVAVVIDFSKYMNRILELDPENRTAWVEPGCVLDDLRAAAEEHGLTFGPDPSTHNHCTLGGMSGNNSCGVHSVMAGRTSDNIEELEILTHDGLRLLVGLTSENELAAIIAAGGRRGEIYAGLRDMRDRYGDLIRARYPKIPRRVSGYNLDELLPENGFHVARALIGSEGTCVTILRIRCRLVTSPPKRVLLVLGFEDVYAAASVVQQIRDSGAIACEGIDDKFVDFMNRQNMFPDALKQLPKGGSWLFVEYGGDNDEEAMRQAEAAIDGLGRSRDSDTLRLVDTDEALKAELWKVRKSGLPATANVPGLDITYEGWEDSAVAPENLAAYLRDFRALLDEFGYHTSFYGHFGDGLVHCRVDFGLAREAGRVKFRQFLDRAADLVVSHGGSLSGEHGDGEARGALLSRMFGDELVQAFVEYKSLWDPEWKLNPGKVVHPKGPIQNIRAPRPTPGWEAPTRLRFDEKGNDISKAAARCVGVGECRKHDEGLMCPSYMATRREEYSTRGRSRMLWEMLIGDEVPDGWRSEAVHDALDFCLACKSCKSECPMHVDMATYKAEFMHHHWQGRIRPRAHYSMGLIWWWARAASAAPGLINAFSQTAPLSTFAKWAGGFAPERQIPRFASPDFRSWFRQRKPERRDKTRKRVILWPDTFNNYLTPDPLKASVNLLEQAGYAVEIPERPICCGRPLYGSGFLGLADRMWQRTLATLRREIDEGTPIIGLEPACVAAFRDELPNMRPRDKAAQRLSKQTVLLSEFLLGEDYQPSPLQGHALVHAHCHHHAIMGTGPQIELLKRSGLDVELLDNGCCGMAGDYGFRRETYDVAMKVGERRFLPSVRNAGDTIYIANGFSCREQARQATGRILPTVPEVLTGLH